MSRKAFGILIVVAGILVALAFISQGRDASRSIAGDSAGNLLLPGLGDALNDIDEVAINGAGRQRLVSLERVGGEWRVAEAGGYPALRSAVNSALIALAEARIVEEKTADPEFHSLLGVEDIDSPDAAGLAVALANSAGDRFEVVLGGTYGAGQIYARVGQQNQSVLIDRNPEVSEDPADWLATEIIAIANERMQRVEIVHSDGERLQIRKAAPGSANFEVDGIPEGRELQYAGIANVTANLLQNLRLDAVEPRSNEQTEATAVSEFWTFDGLVVSVSVNGEGEDAWLSFDARFDPDQAAAFASEGDISAEAGDINQRLSGWQYRIPSYQLSQLTRRMEDLLLAEADE